MGVQSKLNSILKRWKVVSLAEPNLQFKRELDAVHPEPRYGLRNYGPLDFNTGRRPSDFEIRIGLICKDADKTRILNFLDGLRKKWSPDMKGSRVGYPGFEDVYKTTFALPSSENILTFTNEDIASALNSKEPFNSIRHIYEQKIEDFQNISREESVLALHIPSDFAGYFKYGGLDLRNEIKAVCVRKRQKTQILTEKTLQSAFSCDNYWNLSVGVYVKGGGMPWKISGEENYHCYVGVSFGVKKTEHEQMILIGLAEIFDEFGEHITIEAVDCSAEKNEFLWLADGYHVSENKSKELMDIAMKRYKEYRNRFPEITTVHKTSSFKEKDEKEGFLKGIRGSCNLVHIKYGTHLKLIADESYPPRRGSYWEIDDLTALLYTTGVVLINRPNEYIFDETYPGIGTARPIELGMDYKVSSSETIAQDTLKLTKMNLNTAKFMNRRPITTVLSGKVVNILKTGIEPKGILTDFRYYL
jgi:hypothetical protein